MPAIIGVYPEERNSVQPLYFDIEMGIDGKKAARDDKIADAIDYAEVVQNIIKFVQARKDQLIETLAERLCEFLLQQFNFFWVRLSISKKPQDLPGIDHVSITITRHNER